ncbi:hypothetical protein OG308_15835 [Nocardia salmonicida]|uniref:Uncharacterized protein n=1 Tax=Nocardia salmonicida TaxID=53431 RepID=A0ABZ1NHF1_9NOCA
MWSHIAPAHSKNINFFVEVDIDAELAALGPTGYRPLHVRDALFWTRSRTGSVSAAGAPVRV